MAVLVGSLPTIHLACSATRCLEQFPGNDRCTLSTLRYAATVEGWRHDALGDWCPWHSPEQEASARNLISCDREQQSPTRSSSLDQVGLFRVL